MNLDPKADVAQAMLMVFQSKVSLDTISKLYVTLCSKREPLSPEQIYHALFGDDSAPFAACTTAQKNAFISRNTAYDERLREAWLQWVRAVAIHPSFEGLVAV
jgi:hypothetical protein